MDITLPPIVTIVLFAITWLGTFVWNGGRWKSALDELQKREIRRQDEHDAMIRDFDAKIRHLEAWGKQQICERIAYNEATYLRRDIYATNHDHVVSQLRGIIAYDLPVRLTKIETSQQAIENRQDEILLKIDEMMNRTK